MIRVYNVPEKQAAKKQVEGSVTFLDSLVTALLRAGAYNKNDQVPPVVVLWTDKERQWETLLPQLRQRLPVLTFDPNQYLATERRGPAYWLRCMVARMLPDDLLPLDVTPIIYLPGVSKQEMRAVEDCPKSLQPLAELQYRGVLWVQKNSRDWTVAAFLQSSDGGLGIEVGADHATKEALHRALLKLADEPVIALRKEAPLRAPFFDTLLNPDEVRSLLLWLNDPAGYPQRCSPAEWASFCGLCKRKYGFQPETDGPVTAAQLLGQRQGVWNTVWHRFAEAPHAYPNLPDLLSRARPVQLQLFEHRDAWPQDTQRAEVELRQNLMNLRQAHPDEARAAIFDLEQVHGPRRAWVWTELGHAPLTVALQHLVTLARETERTPGGGKTEEIASAYAEWGWQADAALIDALASVEQTDDVAAVKAASTALYRPWLEKTATVFQLAVAAGEVGQTYPWAALPVPRTGTCLLFSDSLRFDAGQQLAERLRKRGLKCEVKWRLAALPTVTPTAKPAISPVAGQLAAGPKLEPIVPVSGTRVNAPVLRKLLEEAGYQILEGDDLGNPAGRAWTELGAIDTYGHQHGWKLARHLAGELRALEQRVEALLNHGWQQVMVITDHGWLLLPGGLPKAELPEHLTVVRKGRCARLKEGANADQQTVPWHWDKEVRMAVAPGLHCYEAGKEYEHGGLSPQECVTPLLTVSRQAMPGTQTISIENVAWKGLRCTLEVNGVVPGLMVDIRTKAGDSTTSLTLTPKSPGPDGIVALLVPDEDRLGEAALLVALGGDGLVLLQTPIVIGG